MEQLSDPMTINIAPYSPRFGSIYIFRVPLKNTTILK